LIDAYQESDGNINKNVSCNMIKRWVIRKKVVWFNRISSVVRRKVVDYKSPWWGHWHHRQPSNTTTWFGLWRLKPLSTIFQLYRGGQF